MKAFALDRYGGLDVLALRDLPEPERSFVVVEPGVPLHDAEGLAAIGALLESGTIVPVLDRTFPFEATFEASHERAVADVESGANKSVGNVVIAG